MVWSVSSDTWKAPKGCVHAILDSFCADRKIIRYSVDRNDTELEQVVHTIVSRGDWLGNGANIIVENNGAVGYVGSSLTVHNPLFPVHKL